MKKKNFVKLALMGLAVGTMVTSCSPDSSGGKGTCTGKTKCNGKEQNDTGNGTCKGNTGCKGKTK